MDRIAPSSARLAQVPVEADPVASRRPKATHPPSADACTLAGPQESESLLLGPSLAIATPAVTNPTSPAAAAQATSTVAVTFAAAGPSPIAAATVAGAASTPPLPLLPFTRATRYTTGQTGDRQRQEMHSVRDEYRHAWGSDGREWQTFASLDRGYVLRVLDGDGKVRLNLDFQATFGSAGLDGWLQGAILDPDRHRLYTQNRNALHALDLEHGTEVARVPRADAYDLTAIHVTPDGRLFSADRHSVVEFTPDLREVHRAPVEGFYPDRFEDLPSGDVVASGVRFEQGGTVYSGYETHRVIVSPSGQVRMVDHNGENASATVGPEGSYWFVEKGRKAVRCFDPASGTVRRIDVEAPMERVLPRADDSFLALQSGGDGVTVSLCDLDGRTMDQFRFRPPYTSLDFAALSADGRSAYVMMGSPYDTTGRVSNHDLFRVDLHRNMVERMWDQVSRSKDEAPGTLVHTATAPCLPMPLADGRLLVCEPGRAVLVDGDGNPMCTYASWREARADLGSAFRPAAGSLPVGERARGVEGSTTAAWERALASLGASSSPRLACGPLEPVGSDPTPSLPVAASSLESGLQRLWDPAHGSVTRFPESTDTTMEVGSDRIVIARSETPLATLRSPGPDEHFTDAMALDAGTVPFVVAGTDRGNVLLARADNKYGGETAHVYPTDGPVARIGLLDNGQVLVEGAHGTTLVIDLPLQPGESVRAGGNKAAPSAARAEAQVQPGAIEADVDHVIVNGIRIPRRR